MHLGRDVAGALAVESQAAAPPPAACHMVPQRASQKPYSSLPNQHCLGIAELHKAFTVLHITEQLPGRHHVHKKTHCH